MKESLRDIYHIPRLVQPSAPRRNETPENKMKRRFDVVARTFREDTVDDQFTRLLKASLPEPPTLDGAGFARYRQKAATRIRLENIFKQEVDTSTIPPSENIPYE